MQGQWTKQLSEGRDTSEFLASLNETTYQWEEPFLRRILGLWLYDKDYLPSYRKACKVEFFEQEAIRIVAKAILEHFDTNYSAPPLTALKHRLQFWKDKETADKVNSPEVQRLVAMLFSQKLRDEVAEMHQQLIQETLSFAVFQSWKFALYEGTQLLPKLKLDEMKQRFYEADDIIVDQETEGWDFEENVDNLLAWATRKELGRISTGMPLIDMQLGGGLAEGDVMMLLGGTSVGKTTGAVVFGYAPLVFGKTVLHFSTETQREEVMIKYAARMSGIPINDIPENIDVCRAALKEFQDQYGSHLHVKYFTQHKHTVAEALAYFEKLKRQRNYHPDMVIIDNPDLFKALKSYRDRSDREIEETYSFICGWANRYRIPIIVTSDVKVQYGNTKRITRWMSGGAYAKSKYVDIVCGVGADEKMRIPGEDGGIDLWLNFDKVRKGPPGDTLFVKALNQIALWEPTRIMAASEWGNEK